MDYRYRHFRARLLAADMSFRGGVSPGERFPDFDLQALDGRRVSRDDVIGERPVFLYFASVT